MTKPKIERVDGEPELKFKFGLMMDLDPDNTDLPDELRVGIAGLHAQVDKLSQKYGLNVPPIPKDNPRERASALPESLER